jgi:hypothetical protein
MLISGGYYSEASKITAEKLGLFIQKRYAHKRASFAEAGDFKAIMLLGFTFSRGMPLDPLINKINGRTKRLKRIGCIELILDGKLGDYFIQDFILLN